MVRPAKPGVADAQAPQRVQVAVRVRPRLPSDPDDDDMAVAVDDDKHITLDVVPRGTMQKAQLPGRDGSAGKARGGRRFTFDHCFDGAASQSEVYKAIDMPAKIVSALQGFPVMVFAYGQTGSGKTHTMLGPGLLPDQIVSDQLAAADGGAPRDAHPSADGLLPTAVRQGWKLMEMDAGRQFEVSVSVTEVYNEGVTDLLARRSELSIRQDPKKGFYLEGARRVVCTSQHRALQVLQNALMYRQTRGHALNDQSSRSHAIITIHFDSWATPGTQEDRDAEQGQKIFDLLERARQMTQSGDSANAHNAQRDAFEVPTSLVHRDVGASEPSASGDESARWIHAGKAGPGPGPSDNRSASSSNAGVQGQATASTSQLERVPAGPCAQDQIRAASGSNAPSDAAQGPRRMRKYGKLVLVDLAGNERLHATGSSSLEAVMETGAINKSLFTLGQVLHALSVRTKGVQKPVPFRDSTLTKLLADNLRGASQTMMLACVNPLARQAEQTASTLHFASVALRIKTKPVVKLDPHDKIVMELRTTISALRRENEALSRAFLWLCTGNADWQTVIKELPSHVSSQLPPTPPPRLLQRPPTAPSRSGEPKALYTPPVRPSTSGSRPHELSQSQDFAQPLKQGHKHKDASDSKHSRDKQADVLTLTAFPALMALEAEFQQMLSGADASGPSDIRRTGVLRASSPAPLPEATSAEDRCPQGAAIRASPAAPNMHTVVDPATISEALATLQPSDGHNDPGFAHASMPHTAKDEDSSGEQVQPTQAPAIGSTAATGQSIIQKAVIAWTAACDERPSESSNCGASARQQALPQSDAVMWAVKNIWFGADEEMTALAYLIHDQLVHRDIQEGSSEYYAAIEAGVAKAFPDKWARHGRTGASMNAMSQQQGVINAPITYEVALLNRSAWSRATAGLAADPLSMKKLRAGGQISTDAEAYDLVRGSEELQGEPHAPKRSGVSNLLMRPARAFTSTSSSAVAAAPAGSTRSLSHVPRPRALQSQADSDEAIRHTNKVPPQRVSLATWPLRADNPASGRPPVASGEATAPLASRMRFVNAGKRSSAKQTPHSANHTGSVRTYALEGVRPSLRGIRTSSWDVEAMSLLDAVKDHAASRRSFDAEARGRESAAVSMQGRPQTPGERMRDRLKAQLSDPGRHSSGHSRASSRASGNQSAFGGTFPARASTPDAATEMQGWTSLAPDADAADTSNIRSAAERGSVSSGDWQAGPGQARLLSMRSRSSSKSKKPWNTTQQFAFQMELTSSERGSSYQIRAGVSQSGDFDDAAARYLKGRTTSLQRLAQRQHKLHEQSLAQAQSDARAMQGVLYRTRG